MEFQGTLDSKKSLKKKKNAGGHTFPFHTFLQNDSTQENVVLILAKVLRSFNGKESVSSTNGVGTTI